MIPAILPTAFLIKSVPDHNSFPSCFRYSSVLPLATVTSIASESQYPVIFEPAGHMAMTNAYLHVLITLNLSCIVEEMSTLENRLASFARNTVFQNERYYGRDKPITNRNADIFRNSSAYSSVLSRYSRQLRYFHRVIDSLPRSNGFTISDKDFQFTPDLAIAPVRRKRSPIVPSIILKAIGTFWGLFGKKAISSLVGKVIKGSVMPSLLMYSAKTLVSNTSPQAPAALAFAAPLLARYSASLYNSYKFQEDYYAQDPYPFVNEAVMDASSRMSRYLDIIRDLQMHRLSLFWLAEPNLSILHSAII